MLATNGVRIGWACRCSSGWLPWTVIVLGVIGPIYLLCRRERWWWLYVVPAVLVVSGVAAWLIGNVGGEKLFAKPLKTSDIVWIGVAIAAIGLAIGYHVPHRHGGARCWQCWPRSPWCRRPATRSTRATRSIPTLGDLFGPSAADQAIGCRRSPSGRRSTTYRPSAAGRPADHDMDADGAGIPDDGKGKVSPITIPNTASGFDARPGWVYLPPAYFAQNPQPLPVLVLFAGQPGSPDDWMTGDRVQSVMNDFAAAHNGHRPDRRHARFARFGAGEPAVRRHQPRARSTPTCPRTCRTRSAPNCGSTRTRRTGSSAASPTAAPARCKWPPTTRTSTRTSSTSPASWNPLSGRARPAGSRRLTPPSAATSRSSPRSTRPT